MVRTALLLLLALALAVPGVAAASADDVFEDCQDGRLDKRHSSADLRSALADMPTDLDEYTNCREIIRSAQQGLRGPGGSGPTSGDATGSDGSTGNPRKAGGNDYGPVLMGEGGLPVGADKRQVDPEGFADAKERAELRRARAGADPRLAVPAGARSAPAETSGAPLPTSVVVLLVLLAVVLAGALAFRLKDLVVRRPS